MSNAACYADHGRYKRTTAEWRANTSPAGLMVDENGEPELELGNCIHGCLSTLARAIAPKGEP